MPATTYRQVMAKGGRLSRVITAQAMPMMARMSGSSLPPDPDRAWVVALPITSDEFKILGHKDDPA